MTNNKATTGMLSAATRASPNDRPSSAGPERWVDVADDVARTLAADVGGRDRANQPPHAEVDLLKDSGLTGLLGPKQAGGAGQLWSTACRVVRRVARGDASIAQLLGYHYTWFKTARLYGSPGEADRFEQEATEGNWFLAGALNPRDADVVAVDHGDHVVLHGGKSFASGVEVADVFFLEGVEHNLGTHVLGVLPVDSPGVEIQGDWNNLGQRLTASAGLTLSSVRMDWSRCLGSIDKLFHPQVRNTLDVPLNQMVFSNLYIGSAEGALATALDYTRNSQRPWRGYERAAQEPRVTELYGTLHADVWASAALADSVARETDELLADLDVVTDRVRGDHAVRVFAVKSVATDVGLAVSNRIFEIMGSRSTATDRHFDIYWRNVRTHTLHDPVAYKRQDIGAYLLDDTLPTPSGYS